MSTTAEVQRVRIDFLPARRTLLALLACALGAVPLKALVADNRWLGQAWLAMLIVILPAALIRLRRAPSALDIWPGIILLVPWLTWVYVPHHAWAGFIPTGATFTDVSHLVTDLHHTTSSSSAPIHSTVAVRLVLSALLGLLAGLIDLVAVVGRRGALAGVPLLVVFTVSGAVPRHPVSWAYFCIAAVAYLILLALDAADELHAWGRRVARQGAARNRQGLAVSAQRIGIVAIIVAVVLPLLVPSHPHNLIADIFHKTSTRGIGGFGATGSGGGISPFAELKGQLKRTKPVPVMTVHMDSGTAQPFYARVNVLDKFTGDGWSASDHGSTDPIGQTDFGTLPVTTEAQSTSFQVTMTISGLVGNAPVFSLPRTISGLGSGVTWSAQDQLLLGNTVEQGDQYTEVVAQPRPSIGELENAPPAYGPDFVRYLALPPLPPYVNDQVQAITRGQTTPFGKARAIFDWFTNPANHFVYSLKTTNGDSGSDLVDFLQNRKGYCQQYAAAMGVMLRAAGVPTRLVLGYMHPLADLAGNFTVTTFDAHAWVEAFFQGVGWIPFDPTPVQGLDGGQRNDLPWAQHSYSASTAAPTSSSPFSQSHQNTVSAGKSSAAQPATTSNSSYAPLVWLGGSLLVVLVIVLTPATARSWRRRSRLVAARRGDPDALWAELSATAVDLGYVWSPARTPRQVSAWLAPDVADTAPALNAIAAAVEERRYAPNPALRDTDELTRGLLDVTDQLWAGRNSRVRLRARLWPASLGWGRRFGLARGVLRRKH